MRSISILYPLMGLLLASAVVSGFSDSIATGPFSISFDISTAENLSINVSEPSIQNESTNYEFRLLSGIQERELVDVRISDYVNGTDVSENKLMELITDSVGSQTYKAVWDRANVGNMSAIQAKIRSSGRSSYITAYSPDGKNSTGKVVVLVKSYTTQDITDSFLHSLQVSRTQ